MPLRLHEVRRRFPMLRRTNVRTLHRWIRGVRVGSRIVRLKAVRAGRSVYVYPSDVQRFIDESTNSLSDSHG